MEEISLPKPTITISEIRAKHKLTQVEFGRSIGVSAQTVSAWESDIYTISPKNLLKIYMKYGVNSIELLGV
ncbi:helix-turn-helix transcriptional regulator [Streptococcus iniae]|uniref:helix-turn-helix transcriptional regulator n=1 Tax=Streptococcus iniae TaxID=1346 RepID=UPI000EFC32EE|nr:helix-turn-helix transcriptional regulator [Streptococcus iniae]RMI79755.1 XRE family transcriptional regulator [Streptococcus iniae]